MDDVIVEREGKPITRIFSEDGEAHFRRLERELVRELSARNSLVIAAGGGVVLDPGNIEDFARTGLAVCLTADPQVILERVRPDSTRPLLAGDTESKRRRILSLLESRRSCYQAIPFQVDTTSLSAADVAVRILAEYAAREER
jgi:shikimate kinase